jgi:hypothetical protein
MKQYKRRGENTPWPLSAAVLVLMTALFAAYLKDERRPAIPGAPLAPHARPILSVAITSFKRSRQLMQILPNYIRSPWVRSIVVSDDHDSPDSVILREWISKLSPTVFTLAEATKLVLMDPFPSKLGAYMNKLRALRRAAEDSDWIALMDSDNAATHEV